MSKLDSRKTFHCKTFFLTKKAFSADIMSAAVFPFPGKINEMRLEMVFGNEIFFSSNR